MNSAERVYEMLKRSAPTKAVYKEFDFGRVVCEIKEGYSPFRNVRCRTCKDKAICVKDRMNQFYKKKRN